ncbi:hypothetical protein JW868_01615 [Candidatus Woesearchaeota archaeon]|nr:hypothetical protein [Candidatus Woesearchaeota archaeon]
MKKKILFAAIDFFFNDFYLEIVRTLKKRDYDIDVVTNCNDIAKHFENAGFKTININQLRKEHKFSEKKFKSDIKKLNMKSLELFANREISVYKSSKKYLKNQISLYIYFLEKYIRELSQEKNTRLFAICNNDHGLMNLTINKFCHANNLPVIHTNGTSLLQKRMFMDKSLYFDGWVKTEYMNHNMSLADKRKVKDFVDSITKKKSVVGFEPLLPNLKRLKKHFSYVKHYIVCGKSRRDFIDPMRIMMKWIVMPIRALFARRLYSNFNPDDKFVYFPLNMWDDCTIASNASEYFHQDEVIEEISKKIPKDMLIVVKEHPVMPGSTPLGWLKNIARLPNVKLVPCNVNTHDILKSAQCTIVVSSTVGWEVILWNKPLVVLGSPFYKMLKYVTKADLKNIGANIKEAISKKNDFDEVERFVYAVMHSDYPCYFFTPQMDFYFDKKNFEKIADAYIDSVQYYYSKS